MNSFWARYACVTPAPFFVCGFLAMIYENIKDKLLKAKNGLQNWSENTPARFYLDQYLLNVVEVCTSKEDHCRTRFTSYLGNSYLFSIMITVNKNA